MGFLCVPFPIMEFALWTRFAQIHRDPSTSASSVKGLMMSHLPYQFLLNSSYKKVEKGGGERGRRWEE